MPPAAWLSAGFAGPLALAGVGEAIGAVAGGYAGKGVGEMIDPTTEDNWLRDNFDLPLPYPDEQPRDLRYVWSPLIATGAMSRRSIEGRDFDEVEDELKRGWGKSQGSRRA